MPLRAIIRAYAESLAAPANGRSTLKIVAMPDHFEERAQENLLTGLPWPRDDVRLLWRSVALCLSWLSATPASKRPFSGGARVAIVDVGLASVSVSILELRRRGRFMVPKRDLPESGSSAHWDTIPLDTAVAANLLGGSHNQYGLRELWQMVCGGSALSFQAAEPQDALLVEFESGWQPVRPSADRIRQAILAAPSRSSTTDMDTLWQSIHAAMGQPEPQTDSPPRPLANVLKDEVSDWLNSRPHPPDILLVCGPAACLAVTPAETLGVHLASLLQPPDKCRVLVAGRDLPAHVCTAHGCAIYGGREKAGLPTYLDTLPQFCILGKDRVHWEDVAYDLVRQGEVEGGKEYQNTYPAAAMIPTGQRQVRFRLMRQKVRKYLDQPFETAPLRDCKLSLEVRLRPAQGFARVRIIPELTDLFGDREVVLDWDRMQNTSDASGETESPTDFPRCSPLPPQEGPSYGYPPAFYVKPYIASYAGAVASCKWGDAEYWLGLIGRGMQSSAAYGSNPEGPEISVLLKALEQHHQHYEREGMLAKCLERRTRDRVIDSVKTLMRAATGLFQRSPRWAAGFLREEFQCVLEKARDKAGGDEHCVDPNPTPVFLNAAGRCFLGQREIRLYVDCFERHFRQRVKKFLLLGQRLGMNNWCKGFQFILRLNDEAVLHFSRAQADSLAKCLQIMLDAEKPPRDEVIRHPYRNAMFSLYYLLRFRAPEENAGFLGDCDKRKTVASLIRANLREVKVALEARRRPTSTTVNDLKHLKALLRFLECRATRTDPRILDMGHARFVQSSPTEDAGEE
ncbi:MAG: hypothetical protein FJ288_03695 [Planctomycetes bacterium]|nr:hypothetical protein [Planctomycetota bacterium]